MAGRSVLQIGEHGPWIKAHIRTKKDPVADTFVAVKGQADTGGGRAGLGWSAGRLSRLWRRSGGYWNERAGKEAAFGETR